MLPLLLLLLASFCHCYDHLVHAVRAGVLGVEVLPVLHAGGEALRLLRRAHHLRRNSYFLSCIGTNLEFRTHLLSDGRVPGEKATGNFGKD